MKATICALACLVALSSAVASIEQCPDLRGKFFCKKVEGSHEDMKMTIRQSDRDGKRVYSYHYEQVGKDPLDLAFPASDQGEPNPDMPGLTGHCTDHYFYNLRGTAPRPDTLVNGLDENGDYVVVRNDDHSVFLRCPRTGPRSTWPSENR
jgi:hypothetical protein